MIDNVDLEDHSFSATPSTGRPSTPTSDTATSAPLPTRTLLNRKKKTASNNNEAAEVMSKISKKLELLQEDSPDRFGKHVAYRLRTVHPDQLKFAMKLISDVLFEADTLSLNRYSKIMTEDQIPPPQQSQRETIQQHFNQYAPHCITNTEPNGQIPTYVDLGSSCSTIRISEVKRISLSIDISCIIVLHGYGNGRVSALGTVHFTITVDEVQEAITVYVIPNSAQNVPILLGRNFTERPSTLVIKDDAPITVFQTITRATITFYKSHPRKIQSYLTHN
ncbi:unnamed protein product [Psylliodes chrysocephalus]|uniref:Uncharacterized protein n=1 Tax=Psylliodes chrysocephalus TaxID=3402493 RepID=A0A9P0CX96_9CUCU|nr:unnamed protein product [Psylliodes chrysocephala]